MVQNQHFVDEIPSPATIFEMAKQEIIPIIPKELLKYSLMLIGITIALLYLSFVIKVELKTLGVIFFFILLGAFSRLPQRASSFAFGIELCTLVTIITAILYGSIAGAIVGIFALTLSGFYTKEAPQDLLISIIGFALLGYFTPAFYAYFTSLALTALVLTLLYDLGTNLAYIFLGHSVFSCLRFSAMHIPSNYLIVKYLGPKFIGI